MSETVSSELDASTPDDRADEPTRAVSARLWLTLPTVILVASVTVYVWYFTKRSLDIHHALGTSSYDSALYDQGMWLLSQFKAPFSTLMGRNMFGDHASFILLLLVPFYWVAPGAWIMFFFQSLARWAAWRSSGAHLGCRSRTASPCPAPASAP